MHEYSELLEAFFLINIKAFLNSSITTSSHPFQGTFGLDLVQSLFIIPQVPEMLLGYQSST